ncbi:hypothetical protein QW180_04405 [Vibrio sinaloensis]|nr:hypothetical protein [Vibrio sinaloensis]
MFAVAVDIEDLPREDRISPILEQLSDVESMPRCGDIRIETPDTNEAKELLKFCRKFTVPMRQALRGKGILFAKDSPKKPVLHICFVEPGHCYVGYSLPSNNSQFTGFKITTGNSCSFSDANGKRSYLYLMKSGWRPWQIWNLDAERAGDRTASTDWH